MKWFFNGLFGRLICGLTDHNRVVDSVMRRRNGEQVVFWRCERCGADNYHEQPTVQEKK